MAGVDAPRVVLVTGAGSGIGAAVAARFHASGSAVVLVDRSGQERDRSLQLGERALAVHADVSVAQDVTAAVATTVDAFGTVDVLVNCAGIAGDRGPLAGCSEENFDAVFGVNVKGAFLSMRAAIPHMVDRGGVIVNIASISAGVAFAEVPVYCASKGALVSLTRCVAVDYAARSVRANTISPGLVDTPMAGRHDGSPTPGTPIARLARPEEIADLAHYLASPEASFITGTTVTIDGGFSAV